MTLIKTERKKNENATSLVVPFCRMGPYCFRVFPKIIRSHRFGNIGERSLALAGGWCCECASGRADRSDVCKIRRSSYRRAGLSSDQCERDGGFPLPNFTIHGAREYDGFNDQFNDGFIEDAPFGPVSFNARSIRVEYRYDVLHLQTRLVDDSANTIHDAHGSRNDADDGATNGKHGNDERTRDRDHER